MAKSRVSGRLDRGLLAAVLAICLYGLVALYSATALGTGWGRPSEFVVKQAAWLAISLVAFALTLVFDYRRLARWHWVLYLLVLFLLVFVLKEGEAPTGAASWIALGSFRLQPSELAKIAVILSLASFVGRRTNALTKRSVLLWSLAIAIVPVGLVLVQPDFGTALVIVAIWFGMLYLAGAKAEHLTVVLIGGLLCFVLLWNLNRVPTGGHRRLGRVLRDVGLKQYQKDRLLVFLHPEVDPLGAGYQITISRLAITSGGLFGRGLFPGEESQLRTLPERHNDFIFAVLGEDLGLAGCVLMLALFFFVFWRGLTIARRARDPVGTLLAAGVVTMLVFHTAVNVGMTMNIMPITGLPLPFVSYGGSNLLISFVAFGLLQNVHMRS